jgi:hypothetical protein
MPTITRLTACRIVILSETRTVQKAWSSLAEWLYIINTRDNYIDFLSPFQIEQFLEEAEKMTDEDIKKIFATR